MSVSLLVESVPTDNNTGMNQTLVVPNYSKGVVELYHRFSTGQRGRADSWKIVSIDSLPSDVVFHEPVALRMTENDHESITLGKVTTLAVKAMNASGKAPSQSTVGKSHSDMVIELVDRLQACDSSLSQYLTDSRFANSAIVIDPLVAPAVAEIDTTTGNVTVEVSKPLVTASAPVMELATVPDIKWSQNYINRKIVGDTTEFDVFDVAMREHQNVLITGHAGSGKTMSVMAYASARGYRYYNVSSHIGVEPSQLFGKWNPNESGHFHWQDGAVTDCVRNGGVLLLNEVNFLPERVSTVLFSLLDYRREIQLMDKDGEVVKAHPDLLIVADMNPNYRGTRELNEAWKDRYEHKLEYPYDPSIERKLIKNPAVIEMANQLRHSFEQDELQTPVSTRSLVAFMRNTENLGLDYAIMSYLNNFPVREQAPVKLVIDTHRNNIEEAFGNGITIVADSIETIGG